MANSKEYGNEMIVAKIKDGHTECYEELWQNLEQFIRLKASDFAQKTGMQDYLDDMMQEAYLVLPLAVDYYDEKYNKCFAGVLTDFFLPRAFCTACYGGRSAADFKKPLNNYVSFDAPLLSDDDSEMTLLDILTDENAQTYFDRVEEGDYWISIGKYLKQGIDSLKNKQERTLLRYMLEHGGCSYGEAFKAKAIGEVSRERYRQVFHSARRNLLTWINGKGHEDAVRCGLVYSHKYYAGGLKAFKDNDFTSNVELIVLKHEAMSERYK